jgi:membrane protease YdiL (CAAX protease family)
MSDFPDRQAPALKPETPWWLLLVVLGWLILANLPAFVVGFIGALSLRVAGIRLDTAPTAQLVINGLGAFGAQCVLLLAAWIRGRMVGQGDLRAGWSVRPVRKKLLIALLMVVTGLYAAFLAVAVHIARPEIAEQFLSKSLWLQIPILLVVLVLAPVAEELFFRGWLWNALSKHWGALLTASVTGFLWLFVHLEQGIFMPAALLPIAVILALARHFGRSVYASIAVHATLNLVGQAVPLIAVSFS